MFLTVAVPVHNARAYLPEAVESVLAQTETDYELLLVDDGSTDGSGELCDRYALSHPDKVRALHTENRGSLLARRTGFVEAQGEYVWSIDADDKIIDREAFAKIRAAIGETGADLAFFLATRDERGRTPWHSYPFKDRAVLAGADKEPLYRLFLTGTGMSPLWNKVFQRTLVDGGDDYAKYPVTMGDDCFQSLPVAANARKCVFLKEVFYYYRPAAGSLTLSWDAGYLASCKACMTRLGHFLDVWGLAGEKEYRDLFLYRCLLEYVDNARRVLFCGEAEKGAAMACLQDIGEDELFREGYAHAKELPLRIRRIAAFLLYHHMYSAFWHGIRWRRRLKDFAMNFKGGFAGGKD